MPELVKIKAITILKELKLWSISYKVATTICLLIVIVSAKQIEQIET